MNIDRKLIRLWCQLAPDEYFEGWDVMSSVLHSIDRRGWNVNIEEIMIDGRHALRATVTHGSPVLSVLGEEDVILAAYVDALQSVQWIKNGII